MLSTVSTTSPVRLRGLPPRMRVLFVTTYHRTGGWLAEAFAADSAVEVILEEAVGMAAGLARLRDEAFDAVLVSHEPGELDALEMVEALRTGASDEPLVVLGAQSEQEMAPLCYEVGADAYVCVNTTTTRNLIWMLARACSFQRLSRENRRLAQSEQHRLQLEHDEAQRLLDEQRSLIHDLEAVAGPCELDKMPVAANHGAGEAARRPLPALPDRLVAHYRELLRAYVIMGSGNLAGELHALAGLMATAGVTAPEAMHLHLEVVEELVRGLGARSARHVMSRADLLVLEIMVHLCEGYRSRYQDRLHPPEQQLLPGFTTAPNNQAA